jgi:hypothetical protein
MEQHTAQRTRPTVITVAVALWWAAVGVRLFLAVFEIVEATLEVGGAIVGLAAGLLFTLAWSALFVWLATRMGRGSGSARLWLAIIAGLTACGAVFTIVTVGPDWRLVDSACMVVAAVLSYLPSARPFFPREERRPGAAEPCTIGWDPTTGVRIVEPPASGDRAH